MKYRHAILAAATALLPALVFGNGGADFVGLAQAQQMGTAPFSFSPRNPSLAAQMQFQRNLPANSAAESSAAGLSALSQYFSSSTSIGNLNQITQTLSGGSNGTIGESEQSSHGNQGSSASTETTLNNTAVQANQGVAVAGGDAPGNKVTVQPDDSNGKDKDKSDQH